MKTLNVAIGSEKGGAGKTPLTAELAQTLANLGFDIGVIDWDTSVHFFDTFQKIANRDECIYDFDVLDPNKSNKGYDIILHDTPAGWITWDVNAIGELATNDLVIVPAQPSKRYMNLAQNTIDKLDKQNYSLDKVIPVTVNVNDISEVNEFQMLFDRKPEYTQCYEFMPHFQNLIDLHDMGILVSTLDKAGFEKLCTFIEPEQLAYNLETNGYAPVFEFNNQMGKLANYLVNKLGLKKKKVAKGSGELIAS